MRLLTAARLLPFLGFGLVTLAQADAQPLHAVRPIPGYSCMALNLTEQQMFDPNAVPPVMERPSPTSRTIGLASAVVMTADPAQAQNGYIAMMMPNGRHGWIAADKLKPYRSTSNPPARCVPSIMSDGRPGIAFPQ